MSTRAIILIACAILCACTALVLKMIRKAPEAHEDAKGFRLGPPQAGNRRSKSDSKVA